MCLKSCNCADCLKRIEEEDECLHEESECGICNDCGKEIDWVSRIFKESD